MGEFSDDLKTLLREAERYKNELQRLGTSDRNTLNARVEYLLANLIVMLNRRLPS